MQTTRNWNTYLNRALRSLCCKLDLASLATRSMQSGRTYGCAGRVFNLKWPGFPVWGFPVWCHAKESRLETNWKPWDCNCGLSRFENAKSGSLLCIGLDVKVHEDPTWAANCRELASFSHNLCSALPPPWNPMSLWDKVKKLSCLDMPWQLFFPG